MNLAKKLNVKDGSAIQVIGKPANVNLGDLPLRSSTPSSGLLVFAAALGQLEKREADIVKAATAGRLVWVAYPKAGQLATDLNRDILSKRLRARRLDGVRQIAIDDVWSAIRFRVVP